MIKCKECRWWNYEQKHYKNKNYFRCENSLHGEYEYMKNKTIDNMLLPNLDETKEIFTGFEFGCVNGEPHDTNSST